MSEQSIFLAALEIADAAERMAYVHGACAGDAALRRQVETLLAAHDRSGEFLDIPVVAQIAADFSQPVEATAALELNQEGAAIMAAPEDRTHPAQTSAEQPDDDEENALDFLQASTKPGALGRLG